MRLEQLVTVIGCHAEGEVGRVVTGGVLPPPGETIFEQITTLIETGELIHPCEGPCDPD